jgi:hypothetical protein
MECDAAEKPNVTQNKIICIRSFVSIDAAKKIIAVEKKYILNKSIWYEKNFLKKSEEEKRAADPSKARYTLFILNTEKTKITINNP